MMEFFLKISATGVLRPHGGGGDEQNDMNAIIQAAQKNANNNTGSQLNLCLLCFLFYFFVKIHYILTKERKLWIDQSYFGKMVFKSAKMVNLKKQTMKETKNFWKI